MTDNQTFTVKVGNSERAISEAVEQIEKHILNRESPKTITVDMNGVTDIKEIGGMTKLMRCLNKEVKPAGYQLNISATDNVRRLFDAQTFDIITRNR